MATWRVRKLQTQSTRSGSSPLTARRTWAAWSPACWTCPTPWPRRPPTRATTRSSWPSRRRSTTPPRSTAAWPRVCAPTRCTQSWAQRSSRQCGRVTQARRSRRRRRAARAAALRSCSASCETHPLPLCQRPRRRQSSSSCCSPPSPTAAPVTDCARPKLSRTTPSPRFWPRAWTLLRALRRAPGKVPSRRASARGRSSSGLQQGIPAKAALVMGP
mmetsp:Transcript_28524/g.76826  ORF Transcript_28524/g.76826 Transcript_28524/m.76826 type:complete len:216 (-) Transcript_28524:1033-1680(-)